MGTNHPIALAHTNHEYHVARLEIAGQGTVVVTPAAPDMPHIISSDELWDTDFETDVKGVSHTATSFEQAETALNEYFEIAGAETFGFAYKTIRQFEGKMPVVTASLFPALATLFLFRIFPRPRLGFSSPVKKGTSRFLNSRFVMRSTRMRRFGFRIRGSFSVWPACAELKEPAEPSDFYDESPETIEEREVASEQEILEALNAYYERAGAEKYEVTYDSEESESPLESGGRAEPLSRRAAALVCAAFAASGFSMLALEVLWTRLLAMVFLGTTYAYTTMLTALLCGIALGSAFWFAFGRPAAEAHVRAGLFDDALRRGMPLDGRMDCGHARPGDGPAIGRGP